MSCQCDGECEFEQKKQQQGNTLHTFLTTDDAVLPKNLPLNDDVRLDHVALSKNVNENLVLSNISQKLMLTIVQQMLISKPADELQQEEILPFVEYILSQKNTFCVRVVSLLLR